MLNLFFFLANYIPSTIHPSEERPKHRKSEHVSYKRSEPVRSRESTPRGTRNALIHVSLGPEREKLPNFIGGEGQRRLPKTISSLSFPRARACAEGTDKQASPAAGRARHNGGYVSSRLTAVNWYNRGGKDGIHNFASCPDRAAFANCEPPVIYCVQALYLFPTSICMRTPRLLTHKVVAKSLA